MSRESLSRDEARRVLLAAQGLGGPRKGASTVGSVVRSVRRLSVLQVDSVNVLQRAHYLPVFSRLGGYDRSLLDRAASREPRRLVEYWAHVAALMPVDMWPVMRHRMRVYREEGHAWAGMRHRPELVARVLREVGERGPCTARDLDDGMPRARDSWGWNWSETKKVLEHLFLAGELAVAGRTPSFERLYDLPGRVLPRSVLEAPQPSREEATRELVTRAARALGICDERSVRDYFRMRPGEVAPALRSLVAEGELLPVTVAGVGAAYLHREARVPRRVRARALLSPFDPLVWERRRTELFFDLRYRLEIYVPAERRVHGYYVLPFLLGDALVARVDLKADRAADALLVQAAHAEPGAPPETAEELAAALWELARWLGLDEVVVLPTGDLAGALSSAVSGVSGG